MSEKDLKSVVKEKYGQIALQVDASQGSCCGPVSDCCGVDYTNFSENYESQHGYNKDADLGLGCGIPTEFAGIQPGHHVLDLGSGAGNDCFVARALVGETGQVTGIDFTDAMVEKAISNAGKLGFTNVQFVKGDIEHMPFDDNQFDVVISNCVLNLVPDKGKAFSEIFRVLKSEGQFCVSDVVVKGEMPEKLRADAEMYAGCVSGALQMEDYLAAAKNTGFKNLAVHKERKIDIPESILRQYLDDDKLTDAAFGKFGIFSITLSATKKH
jgi:ubiquinone/menaquinone biosynthesis C-methylase UbiE